MSKQSKTAGKTAKAVIIHSNHRDCLTIEITGSAFDNLKEITTIYNTWNDDDLSPEDVVREFLLNECFDSLGSKKAVNPIVQTPCGVIHDCFANISNASAERCQVLAKKFQDAGFDVQ